MGEISAFEKTHLLIELADLTCALDHSGDPCQEPRQAVNYLMVPILGTDKHLSIPICEYCAHELSIENNFEWYLFYCLQCGESKWMPVQSAKHVHDHITWLDKGCPKCTPMRRAG